MKKILSWIVVITMVLMLCSCMKKGEVENEEGVEEIQNGIINLQMRDPDTLDVLLTEKQSVRDALLTIYEPLFNITDKFTLENVLAEKYAFNENCTALTVKIKEGVLWHNNRVFSADDVIYTVEKIKSSPKSSYYLNVEKVDNVKKINDYEVVFYLTEPYSLFVYNLYFPIMQTNADGEACIGTGPYLLKENDGKQLLLLKNPVWHKGEVKNDGVKFIFLRTSAMAQEAFSSGKIHAVTNTVLDTENFAIKESNNKYNFPNGLFEFIGFNTTNGIFAEEEMRRAAAYAVDREELAQAFDSATVSPFPVMKGSDDFTPIYETVDYSSEYAMEIIFSAGWRDNDNDGVFEKNTQSGEEELKVSFLVADQDKLRVEAAKKIAEQLSRAGFAVSMECVNITEYNTRIAGGEFDMFLGAVYYKSPYDMKEIMATGGKVNYTGFSDKAMDEAIELFSSASDLDTATVAFSKIQSVFNQKQPITGIVFRNSFIVTSETLEGDFCPYPYSPYVNVFEWTVK